MMERKKLLDSQRQLILLRNERAERAQQALGNAINTVFIELGVPEEEVGQWRLNEEATYIEKIIPPKEGKK